MFKIQVTEQKTDIFGNLHTGFVNIGGAALSFDTVEACLNFALANATFFAEFNFWQIVAS